MTPEQFEALVDLIQAIAEQVHNDPNYEDPSRVRSETKRVRDILVTEEKK